MLVIQIANFALKDYLEQVYIIHLNEFVCTHEDQVFIFLSTETNSKVRFE